MDGKSIFKRAAEAVRRQEKVSAHFGNYTDVRHFKKEMFMYSFGQFWPFNLRWF